jgi:uncharacterized lipoprotein
MQMDNHLLRPNYSPRYILTLLMVMLISGCASTSVRDTPRTNGLLIPSSKVHSTWERAVSVLHRNHFLIARESKMEGLIETEYRAGSNILEPWHPDSVGLQNRLESTVQSIRRKVVISFGQNNTDQVMVSVRVHKEIEDVPDPTATYADGASSSESNVSEQDLNPVIGQPSPSRWLSRGRDPHLEAQLVAQIQGTR